MLEPCAVKVACTVLRGERGSNPSLSPDDTLAIIGAVAGLLTGVAAVGAVVFQFWREMRRNGKNLCHISSRF
jgi:hypothetical protein